MLAVLLLLAASSWGAPQEAAVTRLEAELSPSLTARRLLAADADVPRREAHDSGLPLAVDERGGATPEIVVDLARLEGLAPAEAEAEYARALARAAIAAPLPLVEAEQAARQWTAQALVEAAVEDPALSRALRAAEIRPDPAAAILGGAALFLGRFEHDPRSAYWAVESDRGLPREAVRLTDLEDLFALRAAELRALREAPEGPYGELSSRRYPGPLIRAAYRLRAPGTLERLREALGAYDTVGVAPLQAAIVRWRRALLAR
jgi:hypothetical protein